MPWRPLSPELAEIAKNELNEDPSRVESDIQHLKDWIAMQPHLRARTDDQWLLAFLRTSKFSLERAKSKLDAYYTLRSTAADLTDAVKIGDPKFHELLDLGSNILLPKTAGATGPRIALVCPGKVDPTKYTTKEAMCVSLFLQKILIMEDDAATVVGIRTIIDLEGVTLGHLAQMTPNLMKKMTALMQDAAPIRVKSAHYLNTPNGFETVFNFIKALLSDKMKKRLKVHNKNYEEMYEYIPKEILPAEYGGDAGTMQEINEYWKRKVAEYAEFFEEDEQFGTDEKKRIGKPRTSEEMFGVEGSFRQLELD